MKPYANKLSWGHIPDNAVFLAYDINMAKAPDNAGSDFYIHYPGFQYYPIVGISHYQASMYCRWRSKKVSNLINKRYKQVNNPQRVYFQFRLPTHDEWEYAASGGLDIDKYPYGYKKAWVGYDSITIENIIKWNPGLSTKACKSILKNVKPQEKPAFICKYKLPGILKKIRTNHCTNMGITIGEIFIAENPILMVYTKWLEM